MKTLFSIWIGCMIGHVVLYLLSNKTQKDFDARIDAAIWTSAGIVAVVICEIIP